MGAVAYPKIHALLPSVLPRQIGSSATKDVRINRKEPQNWERWYPAPLGWGG